MRRLRNRRMLFILPISAILLSLFTPFAVGQPVRQAMIVPNAVLSGRIQWVEDLPARSRSFAYAILYLDSTPRSVNNALPLRFDLDTTRLEDGHHTIKVEFFDGNEKYDETPTTPVIVANHTLVAVHPQVVTSSMPPVPSIIVKHAPVTVRPMVFTPHTKPSKPLATANRKPALPAPVKPVLVRMGPNPLPKTCARPKPPVPVKAAFVSMGPNPLPKASRKPKPLTPVKPVLVLMGPNPLPKANIRTKSAVPVKPSLVLMGPNPLPKPISFEKPLHVFIGGRSAIEELAPFLLKDRTMALLRPMTAVVGGTLDWNGTSGIAAIQQHTIHFSLNSSRVRIDGRIIELARPLLRRQGRIFAPISLWQALFSGTVRYDANSRRIDLGGIGISQSLAK